MRFPGKFSLSVEALIFLYMESWYGNFWIVITNYGTQICIALSG